MDFTIQVALVATVLVAAVTDIIGQRVPNWLTLPSAVLAIGFHTIGAGLDGFLFSVVGLLVGFALLIGLYALGGMGAGDVKLLAAVGAYTGAAEVFHIFIFTGLFGGLYAVGLIVYTMCAEAGVAASARGVAAGVRTLLLRGTDFRELVGSLRSYPRLRYAVAISAGTITVRAMDLWRH